MSTAIDQLNIGMRIVRDRTKLVPGIGLILGSGLGFLADAVDGATVIGYGELPGFPVSTVEGHASRLVLGYMQEKPVAIMKGRFHYYEGYPMERIVLGVRLLARLGVKLLIVTNAAGGIRRDLEPGDLMLITDHINMMGSNPLMGTNPDRLGPRFPDMSDAYSRDLRKQAHRISSGLGMALKEGVYAGMTGPSYETPAEIRMLGRMGADVVGMSTVPEVIAAAHSGLSVLGISCVSNLAAGITDKPLSHDEVKETAEKTREIFSKLVLSLVEKIELEKAE
jgi:purine-nucleoside phosphorylase